MHPRTTRAAFPHPEKNPPVGGVIREQGSPYHTLRTDLYRLAPHPASEGVGRVGADGIHEDAVWRKFLCHLDGQPVQRQFADAVSHRHPDDRTVKKAVRILKGTGAAGYVDDAWML